MKDDKKINYFCVPGLKEWHPLRNAMPKQIISEILKYRGHSFKEIRRKIKTKDMVYTRYLIFYFLSTYCQLSLVKIGRIVGRRDHTTVMHGRDQIKDWLDVDIGVQKDFKNVYKKVFG